MVVRQGMLVTSIGILAGVVLSLALGPYLSSLLFEVSPRDPLTLGVVTVFLGLVALAACYIPARRASRADPAETLRVE
jgi:putative ABC transport system permease protein